MVVFYYYYYYYSFTWFWILVSPILGYHCWLAPWHLITPGLLLFKSLSTLTYLNKLPYFFFIDFLFCFVLFNSHVDSMVLGGKGWVSHCFGIPCPSALLLPQAHTTVILVIPQSMVDSPCGRDTCPPQASLCGEMGGAGHWDSCRKLSRWELPMLRSEWCCQERVQPPVTLHWPCHQSLLLQRKGWERAKKMKTTPPILSPHLSLCNVESSDKHEHENLYYYPSLF